MSSNQATTEILAKYNQKRSEKLPREEVAEANAQLISYLHAAAVLHCFVPETLQPVEPTLVHPQPRLLLYDHIINTAGGMAEGLFSLKLPVRQQALKELGSQDAMRNALGVNPDHIGTDMQRLFESYVAIPVTILSPAALTYQELSLFCQLLTWLDGMDEKLPPLSEMMLLLKEKSVLASFEHLVSKEFIGREIELEQLKTHIGFYAKNLRDFPRAMPILSICGPGGIGKSALVGKLLLEATLGDLQHKMPFAYLAFDQSTLRIESPFTILLEMVAQLQLQLPGYIFASKFENFNYAVRRYRDESGNIKFRERIESSRSLRIESHLEVNRFLYTVFADLIGSISEDLKRPVLLVLDTFEEVEYRDKESLKGFWDMLVQVWMECPSFVVIIAGRSSIRDLGINEKYIQELELNHLRLEDRMSLLMSLGVSNEVAMVVASKIGGNPLSLRLAANLIARSENNKTGKNGIDDIMIPSLLSFDLDEYLIQGQLYSRILDHIHNEDVRKLAHPGMVLRVTSPEVILRVLAPACQLNVENIEQASTLFEELRKEHALVKNGENGTLVYRPEIREAMIRLLKQDKHAQLRAIHLYAIEYYIQRESVADRAEEMYHRLTLGDDDPELLELRWKEGIESSIARNVEEYSDPVKAWLASRMSLEVPRSVFENADTIEWEKNITRKVQVALTRLDTSSALKLLKERKERSENSPLFALEAKTLLLLNRLKIAREVLKRGIDIVSRSANRGRMAELFWLQSQIALLENAPILADESLSRAEQAMTKAINPIGLIQVICHRMYIATEYSIVKTVPLYELRARLNTACQMVHYDYNFQDGFILVMARYFLDGEYPQTFQKLGPFVMERSERPSIEILTNENLRGLDEFREPWEQGNDRDYFEAIV